jgi:3-deoxy-D-manno-octulosonic-acid transferase
LGEEPRREIYLADTLGELGLLYRLSRLAFIGGSMGVNGGHNPIEAASLNCAIIHGPDMGNFKAVADELHNAGGAVIVDSPETLADAVGRFLSDASIMEHVTAAAGRVAIENMGAVDRIYNAVATVMDGS